MRKFIVLLLASLFLFTTSCKPSNGINDNNKEKIIKIGTADGNGRFSGLLGLAKQLGYLDEAFNKIGYQYKISGFTGAGPAVNEALASKAIDLASYADFPALMVKAKGIDTTLLATQDGLINAVIAIRKNSNIHSLKDLKGLRIALPKGTYMQRYFTRLVQKEGMSLNDFKIMEMAGDAEAALVNGSVDAIVWTESSVLRLVNKVQTIKILASSRDQPELSGISVIVGRTDFLKNNPQVREALVQSLLKASHFAKNNPNKADKLLEKENDMPAEIIKKLQSFDQANEYPIRYMVNITQFDKNRLEATQHFLKEENLIKNDVNIEKWIQ